MNLAQLRESLRIDLDDVAEVIWETNSLDRAIKRAIWDLSRIIPLEKMVSVKIQWDIDDETFKSSHDVWVSLANSNLRAKSDKVTSKPAGTDYTRDTDYEMDYAGGKIKVLSTGSMANNTDFLISYEKSKVVLSVSTLTDLIRVSMVEYPSGYYPERMASFSHWGDWLYIISSGMESQKALTEDEYAFIFYKAYHAMPTEIADASYPDFLDEVVIKGGAAYALLIRSLDLQHKSANNLDSAVAALVLARAIHTDITTDLGKVDTELAATDTALDKVATELAKASTTLDKVQTYGGGAKDAYDAVVSLVSSAQSSLSGAASEVTAAAAELADHESVWASLDDYIVGGAGIKGAQPFLEQGLSQYINKVTQGADAAELVRRYAESEVAIAALWGDKAQRFLIAAQVRVASADAKVTEASQYISGAQSRIGEGDGRVSIANAFVAEGSQRLNSANTYVNEATQRLASAATYLQKTVSLNNRINAYMAEADRYLAVSEWDLEISLEARSRGLEWRAEFWAVLEDRSQYMKKKSEVSRRQYK